MKIFYFFVFIWFWDGHTVSGEDAAPVVTITDGQLQGINNETIRGNVTYYAYRGIPYAKPPTGERRFAVPEVNDKWTGILNATEDKDMCTQMVSGQVAGSEDCLYINVYTTNVSAKLPVMVWIHGGSFNGGSSAYTAYGPDYILLNDVIYVAFNYRLGIFGFLSTQDSVMPGNNGLRDQILALKWVQNNIASFGGDPDRVTIFGQSAGSVSVSYLLQTNKTDGLYNNAIMESGTSLNLWALTTDPRNKAFRVGIKLGIITVNSTKLVKALREIDYASLKIAEANVTSSSQLTDNILAGLTFGPVMEPEDEDAVISGKSWELVSKGQVKNVSVIVGHNTNELGAITDFVDNLDLVVDLFAINTQNLSPYDINSNTLIRSLVGLKVKTHYWGILPMALHPECTIYFANQDQFNRPIREYATQLAKYNTVYTYVFSYKGTSIGDKYGSYDGVGHSEEMVYIFNFQDHQNLTDANFKLSQKVLRLWTNFAKSGDPNSPVLGSDSDDTWVANDANTNTTTTFNYLNINSTFTMAENPFQLDWTFYEEMYANYGDSPYTTY